MLTLLLPVLLASHKKKKKKLNGLSWRLRPEVLMLFCHCFPQELHVGGGTGRELDMQTEPLHLGGRCCRVASWREASQIKSRGRVCSRSSGSQLTQAVWLNVRREDSAECGEFDSHQLRKEFVYLTPSLSSLQHNNLVGQYEKTKRGKEKQKTGWNEAHSSKSSSGWGFVP